MFFVCMVAQDLHSAPKNVVATPSQQGASRNPLARWVAGMIVVVPVLLTGWNVWRVCHLKKQVETLNEERRREWLKSQEQEPENFLSRVQESERKIEAVQVIQQGLMESCATKEELQNCIKTQERFATKDELELMQQQADTLSNDMKAFVKTCQLREKVAQMFEYTATKHDGNYLNLK